MSPIRDAKMVRYRIEGTGWHSCAKVRVEGACKAGDDNTYFPSLMFHSSQPQDSKNELIGHTGESSW